MSEVSIQKALQMSASALLAFARTNTLSRAELAVVIDDLAAARRAPGRTRKQAYDEFVTRNPLGIELYQVFAAMAGSEPLTS